MEPVDKLFGKVKQERYPLTQTRLPDEVRLCYCDRDVDLEPGIRYGPVIRNVYVVECCTGGKGSVIVNGREYSVKEGTCYVLLPGDTVIHTADKVEPRRGLWCFLDGPRLAECFQKAGIRSDQPYLPSKVYSGVKRYLGEMFAMKKDSDGGAALRKSACVMGLLGEILRPTKGEEAWDRDIAAALRLMEARYDQPLTVSQLAAEAGLERCWFSTVFKNQTGLSPYEYLSRLRVRKASELMRTTGCSVAVASASVGIPSENFARIFKKYMGITPLQYRKQGMG